MFRSIFFCCLSAFASSCLVAQATAPAASTVVSDPGAILKLASEHNDIDVDGVQPWHLKATFQLFNEKGKPTETATLDEIWAGPKRQRRIWASSSFNQIETVNQDGTFLSGSKEEVPELLQMARQTIVHPMPPEEDIATSLPQFQKKNFNKFDLSCVMLSQPIKGLHTPPLGLFPTYCFDMEKQTYRIGSEYGDTVYVANTIGSFQKRHVAITDAVSIQSVVRIQGTVDELRSLPAPDPKTFVPAPEAISIPEGPLKVSSGVAAGRRISGSDPIYPESAREAHVEGIVLLKAVIGRDGHIHSLRIAYADNADLAMSAITAVRRWTYSPFLLKGVPAEVDTEITVNFSAY